MSQATISNSVSFNSTQTMQLSSMSLNSSKTLVFIDANVDDSEYLAQGVKPGIEVHVLDAHRDGIEQITAHLFTRPHIETIHIVSHGSPGCLYLGKSQLSLDTLKHYANLLQSWFAPLTPQNWGKPSLLLYGCNVAAGDAGEEFIEKLHQLTGSNIAASTNKIGNAELGGNWNLAYTTGQIETSLAFRLEVMQSYSSILPNQAPDVGFVNLLPGNSINNGLGGAQGFGENQLPGQDDGYATVDVSAVFQDGFRYFSNTWNAANQFFIGSNGYVTFGNGLSSFSPAGIAGSTTPMIAAHYTDVHTGRTPIAFDPAGNSTGTNKIYYDIDPVSDVVTITFDDVVPFTAPAGLTNANAYQIRLWDLGSGDFGIELRYEDLAWGQSGSSAYGTAGWTAGDQTNYSEIPGSGTSAIENIESESNINQPGVFFWQVKDGLVFPGLPLQPPGVVAIDINDTNPPGVSVSDPAFTEVLSDPDGDALGIAIVAVDNTNGTWQYSTDGGSTWTDFGIPSDTNARLLAGTANNQLRFVPNLNYQGNAGNILFRAWDQTTGTDGGVADTSTNGGSTAFSSRTLPATFNVIPINDQPNFTATNPTAVNEDAGAQTVTSWATFNPGPTDEATQTATYTVSNISNAGLFTTAPSIDASGNLTYTPAANAFGTSSFDVVVQDSGGTANGGVDTSTTQTFTITVNSINDAPVLSSTAPTSGTQDLAYTYNIVVEDPDSGDSLTITNVAALPAWLTLTDNGDGTATLTGTPTNAEIGDHSVELQVEDASGEIDTQNFTISVDNTNDAPTIAGTPVTSVDEDNAYSFTPTANDVDGGTLSFSITNKPSWATFDSATGQLSGTPTNDDVGITEGIVISVNDGTVVTPLPAFNLTVNNVNDAPTISGTPAVSVAEDSTYTVYTDF